MIPRLPPSFASAGFVTPEIARRSGKFRRLMIRTEGMSNTGKTEFLMTAPGPGMVLAMDRGFDAAFDNQTPPTTRRDDFGFKVMKVPSATQFSSAKEYVSYWLDVLRDYLAALANADARTVGVDGDNLGWDLQRLAEHGKLTGIFPATKYTDVYAARRSFMFRAWDAGKIIIFTNWVRDEYAPVLDANGNTMPDPDRPGEVKKARTGNKTSTGFPDMEYLWQICIRHLYMPPVPPKWNPILKRNLGGTPPQWGLRITHCKAKPTLVGEELWGDDCNFEGLVKTVYPHIPISEWGL